MKKEKDVKKTSRAVSKGARLDFKLAGVEGAYTLVKNWKNAALNKAIDKLIKEASYHKYRISKRDRERGKDGEK